ncbi:acylase [Merismopedia glauca]|uniref:Acylase n=1 Tax=Merismopedia glauca CCAP 1448/3 TaxID=1296344 RepID=A0A2T1C0I4_9CYAN|nr:acylase [Merismopedia glauca]PSB01752.1 acylase [Merismopedia glauca CCAP 1448/3]
MRFKLLPWLFSFILALSIATSVPSAEPKNTEILWDTYGIPHIYGRDVSGAFRAFGWAQMQSHGNLILRLYGQSRGRAAEYWGEKYLESDKWVQTMGIPERAQEWYAAQPPDFRRNLVAFADGVNEYAQKHPEAIADEVKVALPIQPVDLLAHVQRVLQFTFIVDPETVTDLLKGEENASRLRRKSYGSNAWAIAPSRSQSGNPILLANPHLPWSDLFLWYEAQITAPGIDAYGATLVGVPVLAIAFNNNLGWAHTVNTHDGWDAYALTLADHGYRFDGEILPFSEEVKTLKVKQDNGKVRSEELRVKRSVHGAIFGEKDGLGIALRVVGLDRPGVLEQWWDMARATNLPEFEAILSRLQLPMFTVMYADKKGHIMHLFNGQVPVRKSGDFESWQEIVPGDTSATLWTKYHPYADLPRAIDPSSGWLQNTNDPPWTTTLPQVLNPDDYPAYMAPREVMHFRAQRSAKILSGDSKISLAEAIRYKYDTRMELSDRLLDDLIPLAEKQSNPRVRRAAKILKKWDRRANANSRGAVLFAFWREEMDFPEDFAIPGNDNAPLTTPYGLKDPQKAIYALNNAAMKVEKTYRRLDVPWGEVFRFRYGKVDLPANGGAGRLGIFPVIDFAPAPDNKFQSVGGDSYIAAIEFSNPVKAMVLTAYGNSSQPDSQHMGDGLELFARQQLHPAWRERSEVLAHLEQYQAFRMQRDRSTR